VAIRVAGFSRVRRTDDAAKNRELLLLADKGIRQVNVRNATLDMPHHENFSCSHVPC